MKNLLGIFVILVLSVVAFGNNAPPGTPHNDLSSVVVPATDNFQIDLPAAYIHTYTMYEVEEAAPVIQAPAYEYTVLVVPEVAGSLKISTLKAESGSATKNAATAINSACTDNNVTQSPPLLYSANVAANNNPTINLQHTNYGYPLSAN